MGYVYIIINNITKKFYIGSTTNFEKRKQRHLRDLNNGNHHCCYLQRSVLKYGIDSFSFDIIYIGNEHTKVEQEFIDLYYPNLYNVSRWATGGDIISHHPDRDIIVEKIKNSVNERFKDVNERLKCGRKGSLNGNWKNDSVKKHMTCKCGNKKSYNAKCCSSCMQRTGNNNNFFKKHHSEETKQKISIRKKRNVTSKCE